MFRVLPRRFAGAVWGVATVATLSVLPAAHLHVGDTPGFSPTVIHRHTVASPSKGSGASIDHGDHGTAVFLSSAFDVIPKVAPDHPVVVSSGLVFAPPVARAVHVAASGQPPIHGPPQSPPTSRAPPLHV